MDSRSDADSRTMRDFPGIFKDSPSSCAGSSWERALDAPSVEVLRHERYRMPSPSITCIDPRLTVLWPSPPASPSEESSVDDDWTAFGSWPRDSAAHARVSEATTLTLDAETGSNGPSTEPTKSTPIAERRTTRSTATTRAAARNSKAMMVKGPDKTHTKWKCRTMGDVAPSGTSTRISQTGRCLGSGPIDKGESQQEEGIEKIHMKLWKCRIGGCNKTFHRKGDAVRHLQTTARHNGKAVVCSCGAPFSRHDALKRHQRLCNGHSS